MLQQKIPAPDGTLLAATVWKPDADDKKYTAILVVTPYVSDEAQSRARLYADRSYAMVSLDRRSRGASGGDYEILTDVGPDACATIDWIKAQPWPDGLVAMRGGSYRGMTQWMTASTCPEKLETIIPTASVYPGHDDFPLGRGLGSYKYIAQWLSFVAGPTNNFNLFADQDYWHERTMTSYRTHLPFHQCPASTGSDQYVAERIQPYQTAPIPEYATAHPGNSKSNWYIKWGLDMGGTGDGPDFDFNPRETRFIFAVDTNRGGHDIGGLIDLNFQVTSDGNERVSNSFTPRMRQAYITIDNWLLGQAWSTFQDVSALPDSLDFIGPTEGTVFIRQPMIRYTKGPFQIASEQPETEVTGPNGGRLLPGDDVAPDVVARYNMKCDWGHFTLA
ncbi:MAG: CocE/NonD family hydrolase, partial [Pseudomonadota bacterium]